MNISPNYTEQVARFVVGTRIETIPGEVVAAAKTAILDCLGVALAGSQEEGTRIYAEQVRMEGARGVASTWGHGFKSSSAVRRTGSPISR